MDADHTEIWRYMKNDFTPFDKANLVSSIPKVFEHQVAIGPGRIAVATKGQSLSYDDLNRWSNRIAHAVLRALGEREEPVALMFRQSAAAVAATLEALKAGKIYVPLDPSQSEREMQSIFADCEPRLVITAAEHAPLASQLIGEQGLCLDIDKLA